MAWHEVHVADGASVYKWQLTVVNKQLQMADTGWSFILGFESRANNFLWYRMFHRPQNWTVSLKRCRQHLKDIRIGTENVRSLYKVGAWESLLMEIVEAMKYVLNIGC
jgi:hypothetical protein